MKDHKFLLTRAGEGTSAIVSVRIYTDRILGEPVLDTPDEIMAAVKKSVTSWVNETTEGRDLWFGHACEDLNIGDLACYGISPALQERLNDVGINSLDIDIVSANDLEQFHFDSILVDRNKLVVEDEQ